MIRALLSVSTSYLEDDLDIQVMLYHTPTSHSLPVQHAVQAVTIEQTQDLSSSTIIILIHTHMYDTTLTVDFYPHSPVRDVDRHQWKIIQSWHGGGQVLEIWDKP